MPAVRSAVRPHQRAGLRGADLDGDAEQGDAGGIGFGHEAAFKRS